MSWKISTEPCVVAFGAGRALLLQVLHPLIAAGVEDHSNYRQQPWRRLFRTLDTMMKIAFADPETSAARSRALRVRHAHVVGTSPDDVPYRALDPALLTWVWATLIDTAALVYQRGVRPLTSAELDRYYDESLLLAEACAIPRGVCPRSWPAFEDYVATTIATELRVTSTTHAVVASLQHPPLPWPLAPLLGAAVTQPAAALLPEKFARDLGMTSKRGAVDTGFAVSRGLAKLTPMAARRIPLIPFIGSPMGRAA